MRILLIEDDELLRPQLARVLRRHGYRVDEAPDGEVGLELFKTRGPDLVVTDIFMPNREGLETIMALRRLRPELPIIAMSGGSFQRKHFLRIAELLGARALVKKPFTGDDLAARIRELVGAPSHGVVDLGRDPRGEPS